MAVPMQGTVPGGFWFQRDRDGRGVPFLCASLSHYALVARPVTEPGCGHGL